MQLVFLTLRLQQPPLSLSSKVFPAIAKFIKNTAEAEDAQLKADLDLALSSVEYTLRITTMPFFSGEKPGHADAWVATKLYVLETAGSHFKGFSLDTSPEHKFLAAYKARVFADPAFVATAYPPAEAIAGWGEARAGGH